MAGGIKGDGIKVLGDSDSVEKWSLQMHFQKILCKIGKTTNMWTQYPISMQYFVKLKSNKLICCSRSNKHVI